MRPLALLLWLALAGCRQEPQPADRPAEKAELALLTTLPIVFAESFSLDTPDSPLLKKLEERYRVVPVDGPEQLKPGGLLLAIQPQALTAERLVQLDRWVRAGGRLVLLADPFLGFESTRPLGDRFRPPVQFADTGLLAHWGLRLSGEVSNYAELVERDVGTPSKPSLGSFGQLSKTAKTCTLTSGAVAARCLLGKGKVIVVADADFAMSPLPDNQAVVAELVDELAP